MLKIAKTLNWLGILIVLCIGAFGLHTAYRVGWEMASFELLVLLVPFGTTLAVLSTKHRNWLSALALFTNGLLIAFGAIVLLGEFIWGMLGPLFIGAFIVLAVIPGVVNYITVSKVRARSANNSLQPTGSAGG